MIRLSSPLLVLLFLATYLHSADNVVISEFLTKNQAGMVDEDGSHEDWIEIFNAGTNTVNLANWSLTDNSGTLNKWRFPSTNIAPGHFLIVWASDKNRRTPGAPLHTNFKLDPNPGEYLALVHPDGTIATQFAPRYAPQAQDISYGLALMAVTNSLMGPGAAVRYLVPTNWNAAPYWTNGDFADNTWSNGITPLGFFVGTNSLTWNLVADSLADFSGAQGQGGWWYGYYNRTADTLTPGYQATDFSAFPNSGIIWSTSNYWTGSTWDIYGSNPPYTSIGNNYWHPNGTNNTAEHWAIRRWVARTNGIVRVDWTLAKQNATCGNGVTGVILHNGTQKDSATIAFTDAAGINRSVTISNVAAGDAIDFALLPLGTDNQGSDSCDGSIGQMQIYLGAPLTNLIASNVKTAMWSNNASIYLRLPFTVADPSVYQNLLLRMRFNDGFVAYLNGQEIARRHAPSLGSGMVGSSTNDWSVAGQQGANNWSFGYYNQTADTNGVSNGYYNPSFDFNAADPAWLFNGTHWVLGLDDPPNTLIGVTTWAPNGTNNIANHWPIRRWVSPVSGTVTTRVSFAKSAIGGNGATLRVFLNGMQLTSRTLGASDTIGFTTNMVLTSMDIGDVLDFALDPLGTDGQTSDVSDLCTFGAVFLMPPNAGLDWNSTASGPATGNDIGTGQTFDISAYQSFLLAGTNVLAIQALNASAGDGDFYILPELFGVASVLNTNGSGGGVYFLQPTPGILNGGGTTNLGPLILDVTHTPHEPATNQTITVTARGVVTFDAVTNLTLVYRAAYGPEISTPMYDDGQHGDGAANDGTWGGAIPANLTTNGQMVRYYVTATDSTGDKTRSPANLTADSAQYYGLVPAASTVTSKLPILHWFVQNPAAANTTAGTRASIYYLGKFFDNVGVNIHGQSSLGFGTQKKSYNFNMNSGEKITVDPDKPDMSDFALITTWADRSHMRYMLADDDYALAGTPAHFSFALRVQQNGAFFGIENFTETGTDEFLKRIGFDPNGALYKIYNTLNTVSGNEKKTRKWEPAYDLQALINGVTQADTAARITYVYDNINIPELVGFLAAKAPSSDSDCCHKNHYMYRDSDGSGEWYALPWDVDLTFGHIWTSTNGNYFDDTIYTNASPYIGSGQTLFAVLYNDPILKSMIARRVRTLMDEVLQPPATPANADIFRALVDRYADLVRSDAALDKAKWGSPSWIAPSPVFGGPTNPTSDFETELTRIKDFYLPGRRTYLFVNQVTNSPQIPQAQPAATIVFGTVDYNPASSNQAQEYIELINTNAFAVDVSAWTLKGGIDFTFAAGTVITATNRIYVSPDVKGFRARATGPRGGQRLLVVGPYQGQLSARGESLTLVTRGGATNASLTYTGTPSAAQQYLRITEIMYHPGPTAAYSQEDFEYIELKNISSNATLNLTGVKLADGITFNFSGSAITSLGPLQKCLVVKSNAAFTSRYGAGLPVAGTYSGNLDNGGERIRLLDAFNEEILDFSYNNSWYPITDGMGFSLVVADENALPDSWNLKSSWHPSGRFSGSPGTDDAAPPSIAPIVINECLTHTDLPQVDRVELFNPTATNVNVGGWFLSDDFFTPKKYRIAAGTVIAPGGFLVFDETNHFNVNGTNFAFSATGDEVFLFSADGGGNLSGYYHGFDFGAAENGVSFGRYVNSQTNEDFVAQSSLTFGATNSGPRVGPVVISEIMYHPVALTSNDPPASYIELQNIAGTNVPLYTLTEPTNAWRLRKAADYDFPTNVTLPAGGTLLVVSFDPATNGSALAAFRARYPTSSNLPIYGPFRGSLPNDEGEVELQKPDFANSNSVPYVLVDRVHYHDSTPWPTMADGWGAALTRIVLGAYGNDPTNWAAALPGPGTNYGSGIAPQITSQPVSQSVILGTNVILTAGVSGSGPFTYQWTGNGMAYPVSSSTALELQNIQRNQSGEYHLLVMTPYGAALSTSVTLVVQAPISIVAPPQPVAAFPYQTASFAISVTGDLPAFQWHSNGVPIAGATAASYARSNLQPADATTLTVVVSNNVSCITSTPVTLTVLLRPSIVQQPRSQSAFASSNVTFSIIATSSTPVRYQWYFTNATIDSSAPLSAFSVIANATNSTLPLTNVQDPNSGSYRARVWDNFGTNLSDVALLDVQTKPGVVEGPLPTNQVVLTGSPVGFTVRVRGGLPINYRWRKNGLTTLTNMFVAETNSTYAILSAQHTNAGYYDVALTNSFGSTTPGTRAYLTVVDPLTNQVTHLGSNVTWTIVGSTMQPTNTTAGQAGLFLKYYWWFNGTNLISSGAAISTVATMSLSITNVQLTNEGLYTLFATNATGSMILQTAMLAIARAPTITAEPEDVTVIAGDNALFSAQADGMPSPSWQWQRNGIDLAGRTSPTLLLDNAQPEQAGAYRVVVTNSEGAATSHVAVLTVWMPPAIRTQPTNVTVSAGSTAQFDVIANGIPAVAYQWVFNETNSILNGTNATLILTNAVAGMNGGYSVIVTNIAGSVTSVVAVLIVETRDADGDGLPDDWEVQYGLNPGSGSANDGPNGDPDHDGASNWDEYVAGTDPQDASSLLKVNVGMEQPASGNAVMLQFPGAAGRAYEILYCDDMSAGAWQTVTNVAAVTQDGIIVVRDAIPAAHPQRFYRLQVVAPSR